MKSLLQCCVLSLLLGFALPCLATPSLINHYRKALDADPQNQTLRYHFGVALLNQGETRLAVKAFRTAYPQRADDPEINFNLALAYLRLNDPDSALIYLDQASVSGASEQPEIYPLQNVYFNLVLAYEKLNQLDVAVQLLQRLVNENPAYLDYLRLLGDYQLRLGRVDEAMRTFDDYLRQRPEDREVREYAYASLFNLGLTAYRKQDYPTASYEFSRALPYAEETSLVFYYQALLDYEQEHYLKVARRLPQAYAGLNGELKDSARSILYNTALFLKKQKQFALAQKVLEPLTHADEPRSKDLILQAGIDLETGDYALARQSYLRVLSEEPGQFTRIEGLRAAEEGAFKEEMSVVGTAFAAEDLSVARKHLKLAAQIYPNDNRLKIYQAKLDRASKKIWVSIQVRAEVLEDQHQYDAALSLVHEALLFSPQEPQLLLDEKRLVGLMSDRIDNIYRQGREHYSRNEFHLAKASFEQLVLLSPENQSGKEFLIKIDGALQQDARQAVSDGEKAKNRGELLAAKRDFQRALVAWPEETRATDGLDQVEKILATRVADILAQARRAKAEGQLQAAVELLQDGVEKWSASSLDTELVLVKSELAQRLGVIVSMARISIQQQHFNKAGQLLAQASRLDSGLSELTELNTKLKQALVREVKRQLEIARQKVAEKSFDAGLKAYRQVLDLDPQNTEALEGLTFGRSALSSTIRQYLAEGLTAHQAGNLKQAHQAYRKVINLDPHQSEALIALRQIERSGRAGLTTADIKRLYLNGIESYTMGDYTQAIALWHQVLDLDPVHEKAKMNIEKAERKLSQIAERQGG